MVEPRVETNPQPEEICLSLQGPLQEPPHLAPQEPAQEPLQQSATSNPATAEQGAAKPAPGIAKPLGLYCVGIGAATGTLAIAVPVVIGALAGPTVASLSLLPCFFSSILCGAFGRGYFVHRVMRARKMKMMKPENLWVLPWVWFAGMAGYGLSVLALSVAGLGGATESAAISQIVHMPPVQAVIGKFTPPANPSMPQIRLPRPGLK